ncbi:trypsin-like serine protease [Flavivirga rizhaonensis]|uniref:Trypsin-like serine protease n=1 Tax=Flavivirga rizhaonensis TaxID=2559571 RepID=A0A4S1DVI7_9FLAO|nr:trypsin-like serine protease [Flavivirga rizhaonensis]TGV02116.1 trypsin-like serine protease [Flavivirga rizhaonensis]
MTQTNNISKPIRILICIVISLFFAKLSAQEVTTFGIRHDIEIAEYEIIGENKPPFNTNKYPDFSSVVAIRFNRENKFDTGIGTGVIIDPYWILTVAHNFYNEETKKVDQPTILNICTGENPNKPKTEHSVEKIIIHPDWLGKDIAERFYAGNDLCLLKLKDPITDIAPAILNTSKNEPLGKTIWLGGYGNYKFNISQNLSKRHAIENKLDRKMELAVNTKKLHPSGLLACDFDDPTCTSNILKKGNSHQFFVDLLGEGNSKKKATKFEGTSVPGDSGGPLFIKMDGVWKVCGLLSLTMKSDPYSDDRNKNFEYGAITMFTRTSSHKKWITETLNNNKIK